MIKVNYIDLGVHSGQEIDIVLDDYSDEWKNHIDLSIYGVEANSNLIDYLEKKYQHLDYVEIFNNAIVEQSGQTKLYLGDGTLASSIYSTKHNVTDQSISVMGYSFSDFVKNYISDFKSSYNVLKLNIEGAELAVYENLIEENMMGDIDIFCGHPSHDIEKVSELESKRKRYYSILEEYNIKLEYLCGEVSSTTSPIDIFGRVL